MWSGKRIPGKSTQVRGKRGSSTRSEEPASRFCSIIILAHTSGDSPKYSVNPVFAQATCVNRTCLYNPNSQFNSNVLVFIHIIYKESSKIWAQLRPLLNGW